jgi:ligand-binding sensor domain-containing protein
LTTSCKKTDTPLTYWEQPDYKYINQLHISGDKLWMISSNPSPYVTFVSILPPYQVSEVNLLNDQLLINDSIPAITTFDLDINQTPYLATFDKRVLKVNADLSYQQFLKIPKIHSIQKILFDQNNSLWVATYSGGLFFYDGSDTARFNTSNSILNSNSIQWLTMDSESNIWFIQGTELFKIDKNKIISKDPNIFPIDNKASTIFITADKNNSLWVSKWDGNNQRLFKKSIDGPWTEVYPPSSSLKRPIKFIRSDNKGTIWIAYSDYPKDILAYYDYDKWVEIQVPLDEVIINDVEIYKNELIIGTSKGIYTMIL